MVASLLLTGCAAVSKQYTLMEEMKTYTFTSPPNVVYAAAKALFKRDKLPLTATGATLGVSPWKAAFRTQGSLSHREKVRYKVEVSPSGKNNSIVRVYKESVPDKSDPTNIGKLVGSDMLKPETIRYIPYEYRILQMADPDAASRLESRAAKL